ncbi:MAG: hypothetical protein CL394_10595 [Acidiferrobacteraceae bacterium]|nr:hypothetical protein [Acidiferrobacteraceae bacterium]
MSFKVSHLFDHNNENTVFRGRNMKRIRTSIFILPFAAANLTADNAAKAAGREPLKVVLLKEGQKPVSQTAQPKSGVVQ